MTPRTILLTGATGKVGKVLSRHFVAAGDIVIGTARSLESLDVLCNSLGDGGKRFISIVSDLSAVEGVERLVAELANRSLRPNCLVNNARSLEYLNIQPNGFVSRENFSNEYVLDVIVPYELTMLLAKQNGSRLASVVNIGSQYGSVAANPSLYDDPERQSPIHYSVAKAALVHLTRELAVRLAQQKVRINCVAYGGVQGRVDEAFKQRYASLCPMGRMLTEDELAGPLDILLSAHSNGITGHTLMADGGWSLW
jgi:NAD(P)-dependent dehydrogenase (short-subunit alcohol dehydrogenase family)